MRMHLCTSCAAKQLLNVRTCIVCVTDWLVLQVVVLWDLKGKTEHKANAHTELIQNITPHDLLQSGGAHVGQVSFPGEAAIADVVQKLDRIWFVDT